MGFWDGFKSEWEDFKDFAGRACAVVLILLLVGGAIGGGIWLYLKVKEKPAERPAKPVQTFQMPPSKR